MNPLTRFMANVFGGFFDKRLWRPLAGMSRSTTARVDVSEDSALNWSAVWCATRLMSGVGAHLPLPVYRGADDDTRTKVRNHPVSRLLNIAPNSEMTAFNFRSVMWQWQLNWGNAYSEIVREGNDPQAPLVSLHPLHPARVTVKRHDDDSLYYEVREFDSTTKELDPWQMLHLPSIITYDGIVGHGVVAHARETIGAAIGAEKRAANAFGAGHVPAVVVETKDRWNDESRQSFRKEWKEIYGHPDGDEIALLQAGATARPLGFSAQDSQFLESRMFDIEEIARWYGIPPHLLQHLLRATFNNIEELGIDFVRYGLVMWLEAWEQGIRQKLFTDDEREELFVEHNVDALLRGNAAARAAFYQAMISAAIMTRNECRKLENLDPVEGGDVYLVQGAMVPLDEDGKPESEFVNGGATSTDATTSTTDLTDPDTAASADVQATALNGAQIASLLAIAEGLATEQLPKEGTRAMLQASFPSTPLDLIDKMVDDLDKFTPKKQAAPKTPGFPPVAAPDDQAPVDDNAKALKATVAIHVKRLIARDLSRLLTKESKQMESCSKKSEGFVDRVDVFYSSHRVMFLDVVNDSVTALNSCGYSIDTGALAAAWVTEGKSLMLDAAGAARPDELPDSVKKVIESQTWSERPQRAIERAENATLVV